MIAPALPTIPQGSPQADASAFEGFLAAMLSAPGAASDTPDGPTRSLADEDTLSDFGVDASGDASTLPGFLSASPPAAPIPAEASVEAPVSEGVPVTAEQMSADEGIQPSGEAEATSPLPVGKPIPTKGSGPLVLPGSDEITTAVDTGEAGTPVLANDETVEVALSADRAIAESAKQAAVATQLVQTPPAPPPLRALAERTARPVDTPPGDVEGTSSGATPAAPMVASGQTPTEQPVKPIAQGASQVPAEADPVAAPETAAVGETTTDQASRADAAAGARDHSLSTLSRATIDATAQIAAQILRKLEGRSTRFEIALRPDELGRVDVKLDIDSEGRLAARLAFDNPVAATDLRGRADELRRQLEEAGFQLADDAFEFAERDSGSSAFDRGQDARQGQNRAFTAAARLNAEIDVAQPPRWLALTLSPSGVDMKV